MHMNTATYEALEKSDVSWCCFKCGIPTFDTSLFEDFETSDSGSKNLTTLSDLSINILASQNQHPRQPLTDANLFLTETYGFSPLTSKVSGQRKWLFGVCLNIQTQTSSWHPKHGSNLVSQKEKSFLVIIGLSLEKTAQAILIAELLL